MYAARTEVNVERSKQEIQRLLERHKAKQYGTAVDYDKLEARLQFRLEDRIVRFVITLPDPAKLGRAMRLEQAERQRWRALLLVVKAKLESVENQIETFEEAFLANIVLPNDQTVAQVVRPMVGEAYRTSKMPRALLAENPKPEPKP